MSISIIIPVYNVELYVKECIESILQQHIVDIEVIAINDGSTDNSLSIINEIALNDDRVRVFDYKNEGQSVARNHGLEHATKDYVLFLDSDDKLKIEFLEGIYNKMVKENLDCFFFGSSIFYDSQYSGNEFLCDYKRPISASDTIMSGPALFNKFLKAKKYNVSVCMFLVKRDLLAKHEFLQGIHHEDDLFTTRLFVVGGDKKFYSSQLVMYERRFRNDSIMTSTKNEKHVKGYLAVYDALKQDVVEAKCDVLKKDLVNYSFQLLEKSMLVLLSRGVVYRSWTWRYRLTIFRLYLKDFKQARVLSHIIKIALPELIIIKRNLNKVFKS